MLKGIGSLLSLLGSGKECGTIGHEFYCADVSGARGEIVQMRRRLTSDEVTSLSTSSAAEQHVCPGGQILCKRCRRPFPGDKPAIKPALPHVDPQNFLK